jgi:hypothetical protein
MPRTRSQTLAAFRSERTAGPSGTQEPRPDNDGPRSLEAAVPLAQASGHSSSSAGNEGKMPGEPMTTGGDEPVTAEESPSTARVRTIPGAFMSPGIAELPQSTGVGATELGAPVDGPRGRDSVSAAGRSSHRSRSLSSTRQMRVLDAYGRLVETLDIVSNAGSSNSTPRGADVSYQHNVPRVPHDEIDGDARSLYRNNEAPYEPVDDLEYDDDVVSKIEYADDYVRFTIPRSPPLDHERVPSEDDDLPPGLEDLSASEDELDRAAQTAALESIGSGRRPRPRSQSMSGLQGLTDEELLRNQKELREEVAELRAMLAVFQSQDVLLAARKREKLDRDRAEAAASRPPATTSAAPSARPNARPTHALPPVTSRAPSAPRAAATLSVPPTWPTSAVPMASASRLARAPPPIAPRLSTTIGAHRYQPRATTREPSVPVTDIARAEAFRPLNQVKPHSFLGILHNDGLRRLVQSVGNGPEDSDSDSESSSSGSSTSSHRARRRHRRRKGKQRRAQKVLLKPVPPEPYDGEPDQHKLHKFIVTAATYLGDGRVPAEQQVSRLMHFLKGRAQEFYTREVANNPSEWTLLQFFQQLFNYCFPHDFLHKQQKRFESARQGPRPVKDYLYELNELAMTIRDVDERRLTLRFWDGLRRDIQSQLWLAMLNPEFSSLDEVSSAAEAAERALEAASRPNGQGNGGGPPGPGGHGPNGGGRPPGGGRRPDRRPDSARRDYSSQQSRKAGSSNSHRAGPPNKNSQAFGAPLLPKPRLSDQEKDDLKKRGLCFICKQSGHMLRNCPEANRLKRPAGKPRFAQQPAIGSFAMTVANAAHLEELAAATESIDELRLASVRFVLEEDDDPATDFNLTPPPLIRIEQRLSRFGDPIGCRINEVLANAHFRLGYDIADSMAITEFTCYSTLGHYSHPPLLGTPTTSWHTPPSSASWPVLHKSKLIGPFVVM